MQGAFLIQQAGKVAQRGLDLGMFRSGIRRALGHAVIFA